jgi:hypothetical protein
VNVTTVLVDVGGVNVTVATVLATVRVEFVTPLTSKFPVPVTAPIVAKAVPPVRVPAVPKLTVPTVVAPLNINSVVPVIVTLPTVFTAAGNVKLEAVLIVPNVVTTIPVASGVMLAATCRSLPAGIVDPVASPVVVPSDGTEVKNQALPAAPFVPQTHVAARRLGETPIKVRKRRAISSPFLFFFFSIKIFP